MKRTLIIGKPKTGKSAAARMLTALYDDAVTLDLSGIPFTRGFDVQDYLDFAFENIPVIKAEVIIVDGVSKYNLLTVVQYFYSEEILVRRRHKCNVFIKPAVFIVGDALVNDIQFGPSFNRRYSIIECVITEENIYTTKIRNPQPAN